MGCEMVKPLQHTNENDTKYKGKSNQDLDPQTDKSTG